MALGIKYPHFVEGSERPEFPGVRIITLTFKYRIQNIKKYNSTSSSICLLRTNLSLEWEKQNKTKNIIQLHTDLKL